LEVKVTSADGTDIAADAAVGPINLLGQTLFQQVDVSLNDVLISDASNLCHYRALFETLLSYGNKARQLLYWESAVWSYCNSLNNIIGLKPVR